MVFRAQLGLQMPFSIIFSMACCVNCRISWQQIGNGETAVSTNTGGDQCEQEVLSESQRRAPFLSRNPARSSRKCAPMPLDSRDTAKMDRELCLTPLLPASCHLQSSLGSQRQSCLWKGLRGNRSQQHRHYLSLQSVDPILVEDIQH